MEVVKNKYTNKYSTVLHNFSEFFITKKIPSYILTNTNPTNQRHLQQENKTF